MFFRSNLLARPLGLLDLVVDGGYVLSDMEVITPALGLALAVTAGFSQLFSP
ncbi:MAG TPA: hypothetical protein VGH73_13750 [Thermoanaerobaculia bacterium]|jgi:hypothetical protein